MKRKPKEKKPRKRVGMWGDNYYLFDREFSLGRLKVNPSMRGTKCMGRFGGGWNWSLGFVAGGSTVIFNLLVMSVRVSWNKPETSEV